MSPGEQSSWKHDRSLAIAFEKAGDLVPVESPGTFCSCTKENYLIHNMLGALNVESIDDIKETFENQMIQACLFTSYMVCVPVYSKACSAMMASTPVLTFGGEQSFSGSSAVLACRSVVAYSTVLNCPAAPTCSAGTALLASFAMLDGSPLQSCFALLAALHS
jgi:hypothetical protein